MNRTTQGAPSPAPEPAEALARRLGLRFSQVAILRRALTHRSYLNEHPDEALEDNERLEFLGDAVLDFMVGAWLYHHYPEMREGDLTRLRSALVCTEQLAEFARQLDLGRALRLGRGESEAGGRQRTALLCAAFEALVGALYLDGGLGAVQRFLEPLLAPAAERVLISNSDRDPKSLLQERVQALGFPPPTYHTLRASGPEHMKSFEVEVRIAGVPWGKGIGSSKHAATKAAARAALERLDQTPLEEWAGTASARLNDPPATSAA